MQDPPTPGSSGRLAGQVAIVTGGGAGIGRAIALTFAAAGADIVIAEILPERCHEVADRVRELGRTALSVPTDVMDTDQIRSMVDQVERQFGRIDILVNNAGGATRRPFLEQSERSWRRHIDINFVSMLAATSAAVPLMIRGGRGGSIVNISSIEGSRAAPNFAVGSACKAAMNSFTRTMALELAEHGIRVNAIAPDETVTPGIFATSIRQGERASSVEPSAAQSKAAATRIPLGRYGSARECADAALFLVSDMASYITGAILPVDGGTWASGGWLRGYAEDWVLADT